MLRERGQMSYFLDRIATTCPTSDDDQGQVQFNSGHGLMATAEQNVSRNTLSVWSSAATHHLLPFSEMCTS